MTYNDWTILFSLPHGLTPNGMTTWAIRTATAFAERGRRVVLLANRPSATATVLDESRDGCPPSVTIETVPSIESDDCLEETVGACLRQSPLVYFPSTHEQSFAVAATLALATPSRTRIIGWNHSDHEYDYDCLTHIEPACSAIVANTRACDAKLRHRLPHRANDIHLLPHILGTPIDTRPRRHADAPLRIGYAGRLEESSKRIGDLITIADRLRRRNVAFRLSIVGDGPERSRLSQRIGRFNDECTMPSTIECAIDLQPPRSPAEIQAYWRTVDCLLLPSAYEGLSYQLLEAMSAGVVPVVTDIESGTPDLVRHNVNGLTFAVGDCDAAADALAQLAHDRPQLERLAHAAQQTIADRFDDDRTTETLLDLVDGAIAHPHRKWQTHRPIALRDDAATFSTVKTDDAESRMTAALKFAASNGFRRIAIYGAGRHSQTIARAFANSSVQIIAFIDDDPKRVGQCIWNWPIISRDAAIALGIDAVVISSRTNERQILARRREFNAGGIALIGTYEANEPSSADAAPDRQTLNAPQTWTRHNQRNPVFPDRAATEFVVTEVT